jgi:glycosyltransferase involved in cell wall biosynthesis
MLGWEFPPHISGGLGTACHGLATALARRGERVTFVLPRAEGDEPLPGLRVVAADGAGDGDDGDAADGGALDLRPVRADLRPYDAADGTRSGNDVPWPARRRTDDAASARTASTRTAAPVRAAGDRYGADLFREVARFRRGARRIARRGAFDVVHAHDWMTFAAGASAARAAGVPLVIHVHSCEYDRAGPWANPRIVAFEQRGLDAADRVICVSRYTADLLRARYDVDPRKLRVVHNAAPDGPPPRRRGGPRRIEEPVVLFLGRVTWQKGPDLFLEAAARVARRRRDVRFVIAGSGDLWYGTVERAAEMGLARRVHFTGFLEGADVDLAYRAADLYVLPSVSEPFGITPLEAARHGVPVLVSSRSGVAEVLPSAPKFDPWDTADLARRILELLGNPRLRRKVVAGTRRDLARLRWDASAAAVQAVWKEVVR